MRYKIDKNFLIAFISLSLIRFISTLYVNVSIHLRLTSPAIFYLLNYPRKVSFMRNYFLSLIILWIFIFPRRIIEIYSTLWSRRMHKWIDRIETMRIPETMKITRKKKKLRDEIETSYNYNSMSQNGKLFCWLFHFSKWPLSRFFFVLYIFFSVP